MTQGRKYAGLPDLDSAPDIYETSEAIEDDAKQKHASSPASAENSASEDESTLSSASEAGDEDNRTSKPSRVDRHSTRTTQARDTFSGSRIDARGVDFSDRIAEGRRSYRVPLGRKTRRRKGERDRDGFVDEFSNFRDDDEQEGFAERLARLKQEVEEMQAEGARLAEEADEEEVKGKREEYLQAQQGVLELGKVLKKLQTTQRSLHFPYQEAITSLALKSEADQAEGSISTQQSAQPPSQQQTQSSEDVDRILSKVADFDSRLAFLETALGPSDLADNERQTTQKNIFTTLSTLESKFSTLSSTTTPAIDSMSRQIWQLIEASRSEEARSAARAAQDSVSPSPSFRVNGTATNGMNEDGTISANRRLSPVDAEQARQISALYKTLPTIDATAPLLEPVVERLKSLRVLHADAAVARENLIELEKSQARLDDEIKTWSKGIERAEVAFEESGSTGSRNAKAVEEWVRELEKRLEAFER